MYLFRYWHGLFAIHLIGSGKENMIATAANGGQSSVRASPYWGGTSSGVWSRSAFGRNVARYSSGAGMVTNFARTR